jgi:hypothetical protein
MIFQKNPDIYVVTNRTSKRFFDGKLDLARSKDDGLRRARRCCSFKVPSTYATVTMVRRLASTAQVLRPSPDLFSKVFEQPPRLRSKMIFTTHLASYFSNSPKCSGAANMWPPLAVREGRASQLLRPCDSRVELGHLNLLRSATPYGGRPWALGSVHVVTLFE